MAQVTGGGGHEEGRAGADPPAAATRHLRDRGRETGAGEGASGQGERPAGCHETTGPAGEGEGGGAGAIPGQTNSSCSLNQFTVNCHSMAPLKRGFI